MLFEKILNSVQQIKIVRFKPAITIILSKWLFSVFFLPSGGCLHLQPEVKLADSVSRGQMQNSQNADFQFTLNNLI